jgi:hypothetical protein
MWFVNHTDFQYMHVYYPLDIGIETPWSIVCYLEINYHVSFYILVYDIFSHNSIFFLTASVA